jgi:hypothetical protein
VFYFFNILNFEFLPQKNDTFLSSILSSEQNVSIAFLSATGRRFFHSQIDSVCARSRNKEPGV